MSDKYKLDDYVDVAERIRKFYERYPDGRLVTGTLPTVIEVAGKPYVWYHARAYRTPDDPFPGDGWAAEPVPGPTPFTRDSELMNAETAAWGRAIVALGFETKKIASAQEVRNRQSNGDSPPADEWTGAPEEFVLRSGTHKGETLYDVWQSDPDYVRRVATEAKSEDTRVAATAFVHDMEIPF